MWMKAVVLVVGLGLFLGAAAEAGADASKDIAAKWFTLLMNGETEKVMELSDVPFSWDRKMVIQTRDELEKMVRQVVEKKGKRAAPDFKIEATDKARKLDEAIVAKHKAYRLTVDSEFIDVYVAEGGKVIGFSD